MKRTILITLLTASLLLAAGCTQKDQAKDTSATESQTALETVADENEQEIILSLDDEGVTAAEAPPAAKQATEPLSQLTTTAKADEETRNIAATVTKTAAEQNAATTTTTKPAAEEKAETTKPSASQNAATTKPAAEQKTTTATTGVSNGTPKKADTPKATANGTPTTTSAVTLPTASAERGSYELPAIPLR